MQLAVNDRVRHRNHPEFGYGTVKYVDSDPLEDLILFIVAFDWLTGSENYDAADLIKVSSVQSGARISSDDFGDLEELRSRLGSALVFAENAKTGSFTRSFVKPLPHQAYLLEKIHLNRNYGHLIADDVGMGKTVEAGLIISAFLQEIPQARILILAPKGLLLQWQDEMDEHFNLNFIVAGRDFSTKRDNLWKTSKLFIASIDTLKQERYESLLEDIPRFDLIICDEAHRLTARRDFLSNELYRTQSYRFVERLGSAGSVDWEFDSQGKPRSPRILLLTATPHQGDDLRFAYLLRLVRPDLVDPDNDLPLPTSPEILKECLTRTPKDRAVDWTGNLIFKGHETITLDVELSHEEKCILSKLSRCVQETMQFKSSGKGDALVRALAMHTFQKIATSSWSALEKSLRGRLEGPVEPEEYFEDAITDIFNGELTFDDELGVREKSALIEIVEDIRSLKIDSKLNCFKEMMIGPGAFRSANEKVLIFTQYRETQEYLRSFLESIDLKVAIINGTLNLDERRRQRDYFEGSADVMISTEAGSEGANLQRKCHHMITYDLSWNPMRMLQRIGRLDRFGQRHVVKVVNIRIPDAWDTMISDKIDEKLQRTSETLGLIASEDYHAMIMGQIYDSIDFVKIMNDSDWGKDVSVLEGQIEATANRVLKNRSHFETLFQEALGMPENYGETEERVSSTLFRKAFSWAAQLHSISLKETRTSENKFLKGVYHFTLPPSFQAGLRASKECYLVFDRDRFSEVRGEVLGKARGQDIKPTLAGFGDKVTDWFFKGALSANSSGAVFCLDRPNEIQEDTDWWIVILAAWRRNESWRGPDRVYVLSTDSAGDVQNEVSTGDALQILDECSTTNSENNCLLPPLENASKWARESLKETVKSIPNFDRSNLSIVPWTAVRWVN